MVKNPSANAGGIRGVGSIPGSGRSPGGGHGSPLQYSCLENPLDRGAWRDKVPGVQEPTTTKHTGSHAPFKHPLNSRVFTQCSLCGRDSAQKEESDPTPAHSIPGKTVTYLEMKMKDRPTLGLCKLGKGQEKRPGNILT